MDQPVNLLAGGSPGAAYRWLSACTRAPGHDLRDVHIVASILALSLSEATSVGGQLGDSCGLAGCDLAMMAHDMFPHAVGELRYWFADAAPPRAADEACLRSLLRGAAAEGTALQMILADMVARRCQRPNHLWQDLGLRHRGELSDLMTRHFPALAHRNRADMKWKKFLYRTICRDEGFALCLAPSCGECDDFEACFGEEGGESLLAHARRRLDAAASAA